MIYPVDSVIRDPLDNCGQVCTRIFYIFCWTSLGNGFESLHPTFARTKELLNRRQLNESLNQLKSGSTRFQHLIYTSNNIQRDLFNRFRGLPQQSVECRVKANVYIVLTALNVLYLEIILSLQVLKITLRQWKSQSLVSLSINKANLREMTCLRHRLKVNDACKSFWLNDC